MDHRNQVSHTMLLEIKALSPREVQQLPEVLQLQLTT